MGCEWVSGWPDGVNYAILGNGNDPMIRNKLGRIEHLIVDCRGTPETVFYGLADDTNNPPNIAADK